MRGQMVMSTEWQLYYLLCVFPCYSYNTVTLTLTNVIWRMIGLPLT